MKVVPISRPSESQMPKLEDCIDRVDALRVDASALCGRVDAFEASRKDAAPKGRWRVGLNVSVNGDSRSKTFEVEASDQDSAIRAAKRVWAQEAKGLYVPNDYNARHGLVNYVSEAKEISGATRKDA